jgi:hypothetical protein
MDAIEQIKRIVALELQVDELKAQLAGFVPTDIKLRMPDDQIRTVTLFAKVAPASSFKVVR